MKFGLERDLGTYPPPTMDITQALGRITSECAKTMGSAKPETTIIEVIKRPRSTGPDVSWSDDENSSAPQWENNAFGSGATTNVRAKV
jgi:hypothetical protein